MTMSCQGWLTGAQAGGRISLCYHSPEGVLQRQTACALIYVHSDCPPAFIRTK